MNELIYTLFVLSIFMKVLLNLAGIHLPVNLTVFLAPVLIVMMWYEQSRKQFKIKSDSNILSVLFLFIFWGWMFISTTYSIAPTFKIVKPSLFFLNILIFVYPIFVKLDYKLFFKQFFFIASLLEPILLVLIPLLLFGDIEGSKTFYLALGEFSGVIILLFLVLFRKGIFKFNAGWAVLILLHTIILIANPARGAVLFTVFLLLIWVGINFYQFIDIKSMILLVVLILVGFIIVFQLFNYFPEYGNFIILRMKKLFEAFFVRDNSLIEVSTFERLQFWKFAVKMIFHGDIFHFLFGYGIGSFGKLWNGFDGRLYPHNMFLETWFELGLIGIVILTLFLLTTVFAIIKKKNYYFFFPIAVTFLDAMKSGSLPDLRLFFSLLAIAISLDQNFDKKQRKIIG